MVEVKGECLILLTAEELLKELLSQMDSFFLLERSQKHNKLEGETLDISFPICFWETELQFLFLLKQKWKILGFLRQVEKIIVFFWVLV